LTLGYCFVAELLCFVARVIPNREHLYRSAISRWYYAAFLEARSFAIDAKIYTRRRGDPPHQAMWEAIREAGSDGRALYARGTVFRDLRNEADYGDPLRHPHASAIQAQKWCKEVLRRVEAMRRARGL
jgi:uncharacterized protein (UPF0332 family)